LIEEGILDASSAINCINSDSLELVLTISDLTLGVGPIVRRECGHHALEAMIASGRCRALDDSALPAGRFLALLARYRLGDGETECLLFGETHKGLIVVTDDGAARKAVVDLLGSGRLTGSLGLLRRAVVDGLIGPADAMGRYERMKASGGFLPDINEQFFAT
jgi:predicted nucleic acid-binding protein